MTALRRIERFLPQLAVLVAAILLFSGLTTLGLWDPWELDAADRAKDLSDADRVPLLADVAIRVGFELFGNHEWAGRLFGAIGMFATVLTAMALARRIVDARGAAYAGVVAATTPLVILNSQLMLGDGATIGLSSLLGLGLVGFVYPFAGDAPRARKERVAWLALAITTGVLATMTRGAMLGVVPPLGAMLGVAITAPPADREGRIAAGIVGAVAAVVALCTAHAVYVDAGTYSFWLGGIPVGTQPPSFDASIENVFHAIAPWSPIVVLAIVRAIRAEGETAPMQRMLVLWGVFGWLVYVVFSSRYGLPTYAAVAPLAALGGACLREIEDEDTPDRVSAVLVLLFTGLLIRDYALYPSSPLSSLAVTNLAVPGGYDPRKQWAFAFAIVAAPTALSLAIPGAQRAFSLRLPGIVREAWAKGGAFRAWVIILAALLVFLLVFGLVAWTVGEKLHLNSLLVRRGPLIAALPALLALAYVLGEGVVALWPRLGRHRMLPTIVAGTIFGLWVALGFARQVSEHFSPRELYETYTELRQPGDVLLDYHTGGRASKYYAPQPILVLTDQQQLIQRLAEDGRRWALFPRGDLPTIDREFRRRRDKHLFVVDASSQRFILVTNSPIGNRRDESPIASAIRDEAPSFQHRVGARFGDSIELLGYDIRYPNGGEAVGPGQELEITWYWKAISRPPGAYTVFLHIDGQGKRHNGDHVPVEGLAPVATWDPGDIIVDRQTLTIPSDFRTGTYTLFIGFFSGDNRMPVTVGEKDDGNRAIAGRIQIR